IAGIPRSQQGQAETEGAAGGRWRRRVGPQRGLSGHDFSTSRGGGALFPTISAVSFPSHCCARTHAVDTAGTIRLSAEVGGIPRYRSELDWPERQTTGWSGPDTYLQCNGPSNHNKPTAVHAVHYVHLLGCSFFLCSESTVPMPSLRRSPKSPMMTRQTH